MSKLLPQRKRRTDVQTHVRTWLRLDQDFCAKYKEDITSRIYERFVLFLCGREALTELEARGMMYFLDRVLSTDNRSLDFVDPQMVDVRCMDDVNRVSTYLLRGLLENIMPLEFVSKFHDLLKRKMEFIQGGEESQQLNELYRHVHQFKLDRGQIMPSSLAESIST